MGRTAATLLLLLAACGSGGDAAAPTTSTSTTAPAATSSTTSTTTTSSTTTSTTTTTSAPSTTTTTHAAPLAGRIVVVDPGHNGANAQHPAEIGALVDAGGFQKACNTTGTATEEGYTESRINVEVAVRVRVGLEALGAEVRMTRADDSGWGPCVDERGGAAAGADLLLSLHADGADPAESGFHVIRPAPLPGYTEATAAESAALATRVRDELVAAGFATSTYLGVDGIDERADLGTLNRSPAPAVMVEAGNLRNPADAATLTSQPGQARLADALVAAVRDHLG